MLSRLACDELHALRPEGSGAVRGDKVYRRRDEAAVQPAACASSCFTIMKNRLSVLIGLSLLALAADSSDVHSAEDSRWISLFDGRSLQGWKASENPATFSVVDGAIRARGPRAHLFYEGRDGVVLDFKNFELELQVMTRPGANSGVFFHTRFQDRDWPKQGFEVQINNSQKQHGDYYEMKKTGSLYGVRNIYKPMAPDNAWFDMRVRVDGKNVQVRVNGQLLVNYHEPLLPADFQDRLGSGTFALQGHDPDSEVYFRNIRVRSLPKDSPDQGRSEPMDATEELLLSLAGANFPLVDFHTHLKGGLTLEEILAHMHRTGINHGIAVNGGIGFPITNNAGIEQFRQSMQGVPCYIGLQAEGREWPNLFSPDAIAKFDYVFTDAMTITDQRGKRSRLWIREEVDIPDPQSFMDHLVSNIVQILDREPIDIYVNPTYLPEAIASDYDLLWTPTRMERVISAAARNGVAIEINSRFKLPSEAFVRKAKAAGIKFTLGTNNGDRDLGRLEYALRMVKTCNLQWQDMWMPKPDGQKPVQIRASKTPR